MKVTRFENLKCWKEARHLVRLVYQTTSQGRFSKDFALRDQIRRAAISTMSNIAEGFGTRSDADFTRFLDYSIRSCAEVQSQIYTASDLDYIDNSLFEQIYRKSQNCSNLCKAFVRYLRT